MQRFQPYPQTTPDKNSHRKKICKLQTRHKNFAYETQSPSFLTLWKTIPNFPYSNSSLYFFTHPYPSPLIQPFRTLVIFNPHFFLFFLLHTSYMHRVTPQETQPFFWLSFNPFHFDLSFYIPYSQPFPFWGVLFCICLCMDVKWKKNLYPFLSPRWCPKTRHQEYFFF